MITVLSFENDKTKNTLKSPCECHLSAVQFFFLLLILNHINHQAAHTNFYHIASFLLIFASNKFFK